jgi:carboxymethylenebutenolidase
MTTQAGQASQTREVKFAAKAGGQIAGALAEPSGSGKVGGVVVVIEWWGLSDEMKRKCERFAQAGFLAVVPDIFHGKLPKTREEAAQTMGALDKKSAVAEIADAVRFLSGHARCNGKVAVAGFCLGGALTLAAARNVEGLAAAVPFYGLPDIPPEEFSKVRVPIQAHFAKKDDWAVPSGAEEIQKNVRAGGGLMDLYQYDAGHAFMRSNDPAVYDEASAKLAWERTFEFLKKHVG